MAARAHPLLRNRATDSRSRGLREGFATIVRGVRRSLRRVRYPRRQQEDFALADGNFARPAVLDQMSPGLRNLVLRGMALLFALIALTVSALLALRSIGINPAGLRLNSLVILWIIACPISVAAAVMPTRVPAAAPSATLLAVASLSAGVDGAGSVTAIENTCDVVELPSVACTVTL